MRCKPVEDIFSFLKYNMIADMPTLTKYCFFTVAIEWLLSGYWVAIEWLLSGYGIDAKWAWILQAAADCDVRAYVQVCRWLFIHEHDSGQQFIWTTSHVNLSIEGFLRPVLYTSTFNLPILCIHHLPHKALASNAALQYRIGEDCFWQCAPSTAKCRAFLLFVGSVLPLGTSHTLALHK